MKNMIRNLSLLVNMLLLLMLVVSVGWAWRIRLQSDEGSETVTGLRRVNRVYETFIQDRLGAEKLVGRRFPKVITSDIRGRGLSTDFSKRKGALVLLFKPEACQPCLITQLKALQLTYEALEDTSDVAVFAIGEASPRDIKRFIRVFRLAYPVISDTVGTVIGTRLGRTTPVVFLVNANNTIVAAHIPSPGREEFSLLFFNEIGLEQRLDANVNGAKYDFGLAGIPFIDVIRNEFDATNANIQRIME